MNASQANFTASFDKCKLVVKSCFPIIDVESLCAHLWDKSLIAIGGDATRRIMKIDNLYAH